MPNRLLAAFIALVCVGALSTNLCAEEEEGYDSPVDRKSIRTKWASHGTPLSARRPSPVPWAYGQRRLYDFAHVLPEAERTDFARRLRGTSLTIATMPYHDGEDLDEYAYRVRSQLSTAIPDDCHRAPEPHAKHQNHGRCSICTAWENHCFINLPAHDATEETVLVYEPRNHWYAILSGSHPLDPRLITEALRLLKKYRYDPAIALSDYSPEPPLIGPAAPWRQRVVHTELARQASLFGTKSMVLISFLIFGIISIGSGITWLAYRYRRALLRKFRKRPKRPLRRKYHG